MVAIAGKLLAKPLLRCGLCQNSFSIDDINDGEYEAETGICVECYVKMALDEGTCFGKKSDKNTLGYSKEEDACTMFCPDRRFCKKVVDAL